MCLPLNVDVYPSHMYIYTYIYIYIYIYGFYLYIYDLYVGSYILGVYNHVCRFKVCC